jgi:uncharacterized lipoprotein YddW (UPF0748 family)
MSNTFRHMAIWFNGIPDTQSAEQIVERLQAARIDNPFIAAHHVRDREKIQAVIAEARRQELTVHGDFCELRFRDGAPEELGQVLRDGTRKPVLCPANPAVTDYILGKLRYVLSTFDYDGITLDDGYYFTRSGVYNADAAPGQQFTAIPSCYCDYCQAHAPIETPEWDDWKRETITKLIGRQAALAREMKPGIRFSAAVHMPYQRAYYTAHQADIPYYEGWGISESYQGYLNDWPEWVRRDHIDFALPMIYYHTPALVQWQTEECRSLLPQHTGRIWVGLGLGIVTAEFYQGLSDVQDGTANNPTMKNDAQEIAFQLQEQLRMGQENVAFFCYSELSDEHLPVLARYR